jgi:hypothetical protein
MFYIDIQACCAEEAGALPGSFHRSESGSGHTILKSISIPKWKIRKIVTVTKTAMFSLFSKIFCSIDALLVLNPAV